jgi:predicted GIY-YIG superfamily endonuclease
MARQWSIYALWDDDVMFYVGATGTALSDRMSMHRWFAHQVPTGRADDRLREKILKLGDDLRVEILGTYPDRQSALYAERDLIAKVGIEEDGGPLLNTRRSSIGPAGFTKAVRERISQGTKQALANPESLQKKRDLQAAQQAADPEYAERRRRKMKSLWDDPQYRERELAKQHSAEVQAKRSAEMKRRWADPEFRKKMAQRRRRGDN